MQVVLAPFLRIGQFLGQLQETVWLASNEPIIIKSIRHFHLQNKRDVLNHFQSRTPYISPLINEVVQPSNPPAIVLRYLNDHLLNIRYVAKRVLEALKVLYENNFVHTDKWDVRFIDVQVADCGSTVSSDSAYRSPEAQLQIGWALAIFFIFKPDIPAGPFPLTYREICPLEKLEVFTYIMQGISPERRKLFSQISEQEISKEDKEFVLKIIKIDPRD
ncbi:kinase-like domain-containing protein [Aspergillus fumigatus]